MDQERQDYEDRDLPPPRRWSWDAIGVLLGIGLFVLIVLASVLVPILLGPRFD
jgi:hypothetical protein